MSTKTFCDKCGKEHFTIKSIICPEASVVDSQDKTYVRTTLDLCDECRFELREVIYKWLYNK